MVLKPHNNRMSSSKALQTHGIWSDTIGFDPHAPTAASGAAGTAGAAGDTLQPKVNAFDSYKVSRRRPAACSQSIMRLSLFFFLLPSSSYRRAMFDFRIL
jgi:hypothetical protein